MTVTPQLKAILIAGGLAALALVLGFFTLSMNQPSSSAGTVAASIMPLHAKHTSSIKTTATTRFFNKIEGKQVTLRDLKVGDFVFAEGILNNDSSLTADEVVAGIPPKGPQGDSGGGYITRITGTTITIQNGGKMATIKTTTTTRFGDKREGKQVTLADLKVGDFVYAVGTLNGDGSLTADVVVIVNPPGQS